MIFYFLALSDDNPYEGVKVRVEYTLWHSYWAPEQHYWHYQKVPNLTSNILYLYILKDPTPTPHSYFPKQFFSLFKLYQTGYFAWENVWQLMIKCSKYNPHMFSNFWQYFLNYALLVNFLHSLNQPVVKLFACVENHLLCFSSGINWDLDQLRPTQLWSSYGLPERW